MNDFESVLSTALRAEAEEISMNVDVKKGAEQLDERLDVADRARRRTTWLLVAAAAAVVALAVVGVRAFSSGPEGAPPLGPAPSGNSSSATTLPPVHVETSTLSPNVALDLPGWTATTHRDGWAADTIKYPQSLGDAPWPNGQDRNFVLVTPTFFYAPQDHSKIIRNPTYAQYVAAWDSLQRANMGTISDRRQTTVNGRRAVVMTVELTSAAEGLTACETATELPADCWNTFPGRTARLAIIDGGAAGPLLLFDGINTANPDKAGLTAELDAVLATVKLG